MKITKIGYGVIKNTGNYENIRFYAEADLESWESPEETINHLRNWVEEQSAQHQLVEDLIEKKDRLERKLEEYRWKLDVASKNWRAIQKKWDECVAFLKNHGVEITNKLPAPPKFIAGFMDEENAAKPNENDADPQTKEEKAAQLANEEEKKEEKENNDVDQIPF